MRVALPTSEGELISEFHALDLECRRLNRQIELAVLRKRFSPGADEAQRAAHEEQSWLYVLDRTMTQLRAVESRLNVLRGRADVREQLGAVIH